MFCKVKKPSTFASSSIKHIHKIPVFRKQLKEHQKTGALDIKIGFQEKMVFCALFKNMEDK